MIQQKVKTYRFPKYKTIKDTPFAHQIILDDRLSVWVKREIRMGVRLALSESIRGEAYQTFDVYRVHVVCDMINPYKDTSSGISLSQLEHFSQVLKVSYRPSKT